LHARNCLGEIASGISARVVGAGGGIFEERQVVENKGRNQFASLWVPVTIERFSLAWSSLPSPKLPMQG
jgi:hypothetical protein